MKEFTVDGVVYEVRKPGAQVIQEAQRHYNKIFAKGLKDPDLMTRDEMQKTLKDRGYFSDEYESEVKALAEELKMNSETLEAGGIELDEAQKIALRMRELREKILEKQLLVSAYFNNTVEKQAADAQEDFVLSKIVWQKGAKAPYCKNLDDYYAKQNDPVMFEAYSVFANLEQNQNFYAELPEIEFLQEYGFMNEKFEIIGEEVPEPPKKEKKPFLKDGKPIQKPEAAKAEA